MYSTWHAFFLVFALALSRSRAELFALALSRSRAELFALALSFFGLAFALLDFSRSFFTLLDFLRSLVLSRSLIFALVTGRTGQAEQDRHDMTGRKERQNRTDRT